MRVKTRMGALAKRRPGSVTGCARGSLPEGPASSGYETGR